jgi:hypothetical protein
VDDGARIGGQHDAVDAGQPARLVKAGNAVEDSFAVGKQEADAGESGRADRQFDRQSSRHPQVVLEHVGAGGEADQFGVRASGQPGIDLHDRRLRHGHHRRGQPRHRLRPRLPEQARVPDAAREWLSGPRGAARTHRH